MTCWPHVQTGLDSSTTFQIVKCTPNFVHFREGTVLMALLQPAPETYNLFDDVMLMAEGFVVFPGHRDEASQGLAQYRHTLLSSLLYLSKLAAVFSRQC